MSKQRFIEGQFAAITLIGMSGVGKSHVSQILNQNDNWYHFSVDYLIGKHYIADHIPGADQIEKDNITPIANWMGILGSPEKGGSPVKTIKRHQRLYHDAELLATQSFPNFAAMAKNEGLPAILNDTTGSFVELDYPELPAIIAEHSLIVYIEASEADKKAIFDRAIAYPKPMFYPKGMLDRLLSDFMTKHDVCDENAIDPKAFFDFAYPQLFEQRLPKYRDVADTHGVTVSSDDIKNVKNANDFLNLVKDVLNA